MIEVSDRGEVRELRLNRPPVNALDTATVRELGAALSRAVADGMRAVVLSGRPGIFSAGLDVPALLRLDRDGMREFWEVLFEVQAQLARLPIPVIAALTGHCPAGGTVIALQCDYRIMAEGDFRIGLNEVQVGLYPGALIHQAYVRLLGPHRAGELLARGALIGPSTAQAIGLVDEVLSADAVVGRAHAHADALLALPAQAFARTRALVRADLVRLFDEFDGSFIDEACTVWFSEETQARLRALFLKVR